MLQELQNVEGNFWRADIRKNTCFSVVFQVQSCVISVEAAKCWRCQKLMKMWIRWRNLFSKTEESLSVKFLVCWKFYLRQFRAFWKAGYLKSGIWGLLSPPWYSAWLLCFVCELLAKSKMTVTPHSRDSPDLAPCYFFLFPKTEDSLKGRRFNDNSIIQAGSLDTLGEFQTMHFTEWMVAHFLGSLCEGDSVVMTR